MEVVSEINRYAQRKIIVGSSFRQTRFSGTVSPARVGDWRKALEQIYAEGVEHGGGAIHIQSRDVHRARS
jgi:ferric-dicitrate binding protein FerR (iron transport regulator)